MVKLSKRIRRVKVNRCINWFRFIVCHGRFWRRDLLIFTLSCSFSNSGGYISGRFTGQFLSAFSGHRGSFAWQLPNAPYEWLYFETYGILGFVYSLVSWAVLPILRQVRALFDSRRSSLDLVSRAMERYPIAPSLTLAVHRRGSTPSLVQFATINAQIKKERTSPSLEVINNADTDEESDDLRSDQNPDRLKSMGGAKSLSQPALNILHITSIRGRGNLLSAALSPESSTSLKRSSSTNVSGKPPKPSGRSKKKERMEVDVEMDVESTSAMLKRSASHGCVLSPAPSTSVDEGRPSDTSDRFSNRRNTWCQLVSRFIFIFCFYVIPTSWSYLLLNIVVIQYYLQFAR